MLLRIRKFHGKTTVLESLFNKVAGPQAYNFIKKRLQDRCFPEKSAKFLRILILKNICEKLLLFDAESASKSRESIRSTVG